MSAWLVTGLVIAVTAGCGTVQVAAQPGRSSAVPATLAGTRAAASCRPGSVVITNAGNGKTFCVRVGTAVTVLLRTSGSRPWLEPLASGRTLKPVPNGARSLIRGLTAAWYRAARPGRSVITSVLPPCRVPVAGGKSELQPADPVATSYPLRFCAPGHRFSVTVVVVG